MVFVTPKNRDGFTLIELLVTIAIIGLLATIAMTAVGTARERAKISRAQHDLDQIYKSLTLMQNDTAMWPGHQAMGISCSTAPSTCAADNELCGPDEDANDCVNGIGDEVSGLLANDTVTPYENWGGPYLRSELLNDPWGREYFFDTDYQIDAQDQPCECSNIGCHDAAVVGSYGPDGLGKPDSGMSGAYGCDDIILIIGR